MKQIPSIAIYLLLAGLALGSLLTLAFSSQSRVDPEPKLDEKGFSPYHNKEVKNTITKNTSKISNCYNEYLKSKPSIEMGRVHLDWQIESNGKPTSVELVSSSFASDSLHECIQKEISSWEFPPPPRIGRNTYADYTFNLRNKPFDPKEVQPEMVNVPKK
ncbi:MAG: AgmX/PglI C-terminal domain-containing protein [Leptospiraceae bacterium]|nr:AgmX/PglI C-terminal domain-containing protein [Leptospiraceae bacterium]MCZ8346481.1 AgmX/PglI C-terminal domain-containing protein [Leptospiraceae bacterium]